MRTLLLAALCLSLATVAALPAAEAAQQACVGYDSCDNGYWMCYNDRLGEGWTCTHCPLANTGGCGDGLPVRP